ncbi:MAG: hypothetical protein SFX72_19265 [Isosphaeraceae bacterium]|nr:hypothetical protein [Isosphaeraceae bacterium]
MIRLTQAIGAVMAATVVSGVVGGAVGAAIARLAPNFVILLVVPLTKDPNHYDPVEFGIGLGSISGLLLGLGTSLVLMIAILIRDGFVARAGASVELKPPGFDVV